MKYILSLSFVIIFLGASVLTGYLLWQNYKASPEPVVVQEVVKEPPQEMSQEEKKPEVVQDISSEKKVPEKQSSGMENFPAHS